MRSQIPKFVLVIAITVLVVGGGVYFWQNQKLIEVVNSVNSQSSVQAPVVQQPISSDVFEIAKKSDDEFMYLVSAPKIGDDWRMLVSNTFTDFVLRFSLKYKFSPWGEMSYKKYDLTATDGAPPLNGLSGYSHYVFCAGNYYCDAEKRSGMGFELTFWNAKFIGRVADPKFYAKNGEIFLKETDQYIVTYKPFSDSVATQKAHIETEVATLIQTLEVY